MAMRKDGLLMGGIAVVAFLLGMGVSYLCFAPDEKGEKEVSKERLVAGKPVKEFVTVRDRSAEKEIAALKKKIGALREELSHTNGTALLAEAGATVPGKEKKEPKWISFRERMENMKTEDPKRYEEFQERFKKVREMLNEKEYSRAEYLASIDPSQFTPKQKENHERLLDLLAQMNQLREEMGGPGQVSKEQREEMRETYLEMSQLLKMEQKSLLSATAKSMGYRGDEVKEFTSQIEEIVKATSFGFGGPGRGFGKRMRGAGRGPMPQ